MTVTWQLSGMSGCIGTQMIISSVKNPSDGERTLPIIACPMWARNIHELERLTMAKRITRRDFIQIEVESIMRERARRVKRAQPKTLTKEEFRARLMRDLGIGETDDAG